MPEALQPIGGLLAYMSLSLNHPEHFSMLILLLNIFRGFQRGERAWHPPLVESSLCSVRCQVWTPGPRSPGPSVLSRSCLLWRQRLVMGTSPAPCRENLLHKRRQKLLGRGGGVGGGGNRRAEGPVSVIQASQLW